MHAVIEYRKTLLRRILKIVYYFLLAGLVLIGIIVGTVIFRNGSDYAGFGTGVFAPFYTKIYDASGDYQSKFIAGAFFSETFSIAFLAFLPFLIRLIVNLIVNRLRLTLTDDGFSGVRIELIKAFSLDFFVAAEHINGVAVNHSLLDEIFSGDTLIISTASGKVIYPLVHNARELKDATIALIKQYKGNYGAVQPHTVPARETEEKPQPNKELMKFKELFDEGKFTADEIKEMFFDGKK